MFENIPKVGRNVSLIFSVRYNEAGYSTNYPADPQDPKLIIF